MEFTLKNEHGIEILHKFNKGSAILQFCQSCCDLNPLDGNRYNIFECRNEGCKLFRFRGGQSLTKSGATWADRDKAVRWHCMYCISTDGEPGRPADVRNCDNKACPLFMYRLGDPPDILPGHYFKICPKGFAKVFYKEPEPEVPMVETPEPTEPEVPEERSSEAAAEPADRWPTLEEFLASFPDDNDIEAGITEQSILR